MIVFHGTAAKPFETFDASRQGRRAGVDGGFFFTRSYEVARDVYGWNRGARVLCARVDLGRALSYDEFFELAGLDKGESTNGGFMAPVNYFDDNHELVLSVAREHGFDGIDWPADADSSLPHDLVVVFDAARIEILSQRVNAAQAAQFVESEPEDDPDDGDESSHRTWRELRRRMG